MDNQGICRKNLKVHGHDHSLEQLNVPVDLNLTFNLAYVICQFELHKYIKLMCDFEQNAAALRYVVLKILIYQFPW